MRILPDVIGGQLQRTIEVQKQNTAPDFLAYKRDIGRKSPTPQDAAAMLEGISSLDFSPDGKALAAGGLNWLLEVWDLTKGELRVTLRPSGGAYGARFYGDGTRILVNFRTIVDIGSGQQLLTLPGGGNTFADKDRRVIVWRGLDNFKMYDADAQFAERAKMTVENLKVRHPLPPMAFGLRGRIVAVGCENRIELWDTHTGTMLKPLTGHKSPVAALAVSPDGRVLASSSIAPGPGVLKVEPDPKMKEKVRDDVFLWDLEKGTLLGTLPLNEYGVPSIAFSPDGKTLAAIYWRGGAPDTITRKSATAAVSLWDVTTRRLRFNLELPVSEFLTLGEAGVAFNPVDGTLATTAGRTVRIWNLDDRTFRELPSIPAHLGFIGPMSYSPDGQTFCVGQPFGNGNGNVVLFDTHTGLRTGELSGKGHIPAFAPDERTILTQQQGRVCFWSPITMQSYSPFSIGGVDWQRHLLSPDGHVLATGSADPKSGRIVVRLWDLSPPREVAPIPGNLMRFGPDNKTAVLVSADVLKFLDLDTFRIRATVNAGRMAGQGVYEISPDGRVLASTGRPALVRKSATAVELFDTHTGAKLREINPGPPTFLIPRLPGLAFSPDGNSLAVATPPPMNAKPKANPVIRVTIWNVAGGKLLSTINVPFKDQPAGAPLQLAYSPHGTSLLFSCGGVATVIELSAPPKFVSLVRPKEVVGNPKLPVAMTLRFTPDCARIVGRYGSFRQKQLVVMWDRRTGQIVDGPIPDVLPHPDPQVRVSPNGRYEVTGSGRDLIDRWAKPPVLVSPPM